MDKYIGRLLDNRYEILDVIGTGGMAVVYRARCHRLNRLVAMRVLSHIQGNHLSYFVDNETIGSIIISVRSHKHRVETGYHRFMSAHQFR